MQMVRLSLPPSELQLLGSADFSSPDVAVSSDAGETVTTLAEPPDQLLYDNLRQKSHPRSLHDQLLFMMKPDLRRESESYISQQAAIAGHKTLFPSNYNEPQTWLSLTFTGTLKSGKKWKKRQPSVSKFPKN